MPADWDREHRFPRELFAKLGELGLMGVCVPEELGGAGADFISYVLVLEELSRADAGVGVTVAVHTSAATLPIVAFGTDEQRERFVPPLARGEAIGAFALTEPGSGSDASSLRTTAVARRGRLAHQRDEAVVHEREPRLDLPPLRADGLRNGRRPRRLRIPPRPRARRGDPRGGEARAALLVHGRSPTRRRRRSSSRDRLLHEEHKGFAVAMATLDGGRIGIAAQAVGIAQAALDTARSYALEREQFGKRIAEFQAIQFTLADMATQIAAARQLTWRAAWLKQAGLPHGADGAMAKLFASRVAVEASRDAIQVLGGYGYTREFPAERYYRDAKITEIYEGTSEIQRIVIARDLLRHAERTLAPASAGTLPG